MVKLETPMVRALDLGSLVMASQVWDSETPSSRATSPSLPATLGKRASPLGKATGQWMR
jgi:hypothetical protein